MGEANYSDKVNFRRIRDQEARREGYIKYSPVPAVANQEIYDAALTCTRIVELIRPDGTKAVLGFSRSAVRLFSNTAGTWSTIGSGYSASGKRWQVLTIGGVLIANNAVDLPIYYEVGDAAVTPMYELRDVGIARVGRIAENSGFLIIADLTEIRSDLLQGFMRGWSTYTVGSTVAKGASYTVVDADSGKQFDFTTGAANMVATLPTTPTSANFYVWIKKVDAGVGIVTTLPLIVDTVVSLATINALTLIWWDAVLGRYCAVYFAGAVPADAPYGTPPTNITNRLPWSVSNGEYGEPTRWAPVFAVMMTAASTSIVLPFATTVFVANETRVAVVNGGPLGGTLGGQEATPIGVLVTAVSGRTLTLQVTTDTAITYPRIVYVMRWTDVSSLVGRYDLQGDNSEITTVVSLRNWMVLFRETGIYIGRYTGDPAAPFVFTPAYTGGNVPLWPDAVANIKNDYLLYPARGNRMCRYDGVTWPEVHEVTDDAASLFFGSDDQVDEVYAAENTITKEWWFFYPDRTVCFDYDTKFGTVSKINQLFDCAAMIHKPGTSDLWFVIGIAKNIYTYGLVYGATPIQTWFRDGVAPTGTVLSFGLNSFGDEANEKLLLSYTPIFSSQSPNADIEVQINSAWNPSATPVALLSPVETLPSPKGRNFIPLAFQAIYVQDVITLVETTDIDVRLTMRIWEVELVKAGGVTRSIDI